jgi:hypothetical protein
MTMIPAFLLQGDSGPAVGGSLLAMGGTMVLLMLAIGLVFLVATWKVFVKAGQPGWAVLIPFYNFYILLKIAGRPGWWLVLLLIPLVNLVIMVILAVDIAKAFGKSAVFGVVLLFLLGGIGYLVLGFGNAHYVKPATALAR